MFCGFAIVHLSTFQGQEMEAVLNAANAAAVIESVVQQILSSLCSVTCVHTKRHMKNNCKLLHASADIQQMRRNIQFLRDRISNVLLCHLSFLHLAKASVLLVTLIK